ncbi:helix-turn-helix domain-containing protein [Streptomyces sp. NPDC002787]
MTRWQLSELIDSLTPAMEVQREQVLRTRRGHERLVAPGAGAKAKLTSADRVLVTLLHLRKLATTDLLGQLFNTTAMTISRAVKDARPLLEAHGVHLPAQLPVSARGKTSPGSSTPTKPRSNQRVDSRQALIDPNSKGSIRGCSERAGRRSSRGRPCRWITS